MEHLQALLLGDTGTTSPRALISGPTAMGKTVLLHALARRATSSGRTVLLAASTRAEQDVPYATVRKLLKSRSATTSRRPAHRGSGDEAAQVAGAARRTVAELAGRGPVLVAVDDLQYTDTESLRWLRQLVQEVAPGTLALAVTLDPQLDRPPSGVLQDLLYHPQLRRVDVGPLGPRGVRQLVRERLGPVAADRLALPLHAWTGGNPLLVRALLTDQADGRTQPPEPTAGAAFRQAVLVCLHRLGEPAVQVARGVAVLEESADVHLVGRLTGLGSDLTRRTVEKLSDTGILDGTRFRHPDGGTVVLEAVPAGEAVRLRDRAARLLLDDGAPSEVIARQLLGAGPAPGDWTVPVLQDAALHALTDDRPDCAIGYLKRALECATDDGERHVVKARLASVHWLLAPGSARDRFFALKAPILEGRLGRAQAQVVAESMLWQFQFDDAVEVLGKLAADGGDATQAACDAALTRSLVGNNFPGLLPRIEEFGGPPAGVPELPVIATPELRSAQALSAVLGRRADEHTVAQAQQVLQDVSFYHSSCRAVTSSVLSLVYSDLLEEAADWCRRFLTEADRHRLAAWQGIIGGLAALTELRRGRLDDAAASAERAMDRLGGETWNESYALALATRVEAMTAMGQYPAAAGLLPSAVPPGLFETRVGLHYLYARGRHHLAAGRCHAALADFSVCGELMVKWHIDNAALVPWRAGAAEAWLRIGERDRAAALLHEQRLPHTGGRHRTRGIVLRSLAATRTVRERPALLEEALRLLERGGDLYHSACALAELSEAYQSVGDTVRARAAARRARLAAQECRAGEVLPLLSPVPPLKEQRPHPDDDRLAKLSESERRVAVLAAQGFTNREVAARLYITVSTVEQHLTRIYRKMQIRNREELPIELRLAGDVGEAI